MSGELVTADTYTSLRLCKPIVHTGGDNGGGEGRALCVQPDKSLYCNSVSIKNVYQQSQEGDYHASLSGH